MTMGSFLNPVVYPLIDRVTYATPFTEKYFFGKYIDQILILSLTSLWMLFSSTNKLRYIFSFIYGLSAFVSLLQIYPAFTEISSLLTFPIIFLFLIMSKITQKNFVSLDKRIFTNMISTLGIIIGIWGLAISIIQLLTHDIVLPAINYFYYLYLIFSIFSPILLVVIGLSIPIKIMIIKFYQSRNKSGNVSNPTTIASLRIKRLKTTILSLIGIIGLSIFVIWIPHSDSINIDNQIIGSDTKDYEKLLGEMNSSRNIQELAVAFISQIQKDRSFSLITFYLLSQFTDPTNLINALELLPFILAPLLILSFYFLTLELTSNHFTSIVSAFLSAITFQTLVGVYGGLYANWYTLIFVNLTLLFLMRSIRAPSRKHLIAFSILLTVVLLSHEPTWPIIILVIFIFLTILIILKPSLRNTMFYIFLAILPSFIIELFKTVFFRQSGVTNSISFASSQGLGFQDLYNIWNNLITATQTYLAGLFSNSIIFGLVIYWVSICSIKDKSNILILIFLSLLIFPTLFGDPEVVSRVLYEIPFQIPAAIALTQIKKSHGKLLFLTICLWIVAVSIRSASNLYFNPQI
jgi:hypothetical protein